MPWSVFIRFYLRPEKHMSEVRKTVADKHGNIFLRIEEDTEADLLYAKWKGKISLDDIKTGSLAFLDVLEEWPCARLLSDNTELDTGWQTLNDWVEHTWTPKALALQLRYFAIVVSPHFFVKVAAVELSQRIGNRLEIQVFADVASARRWLSEV
jgi:hypothetical protein